MTKTVVSAAASAAVAEAGARRYFGTDGVRGRVGRAPMTPDFLVRLGHAAGRVLAAGAPAGEAEVLISKDTRLSGYMVESALEAGLAAAGVNVLLSGPLPTSAVSHLTPALRLTAGVVISASHNPHLDNGVKFFGGDGRKLPDEVEWQIERELETCPELQFDGAPGRARRLDGGAERYIEFCKRAFPADMDLRGLRIVVDCANGAAYHVAPSVFHELGAEVFAIGDKPDGHNINVECGALAPAAAQAAVRQHKAHAGIVLDGDADRVQLVDEKGKLHDGDALLFLIARDQLQRGKGVGGVVGTVLSNLALEKNLQAMGVGFARAEVGDRYVSELMNKHKWRVGGEPSGHLVLRKFHHTGDGIVAGLQALRAMRNGDAPLSALLREYSPMPQVCKNLRVAGHREALRQPQTAQALQALQAQCKGDGMRLVARPSGTEPIIRLMAEGEDKAALRRVVAAAQKIIGAAAGKQKDKRRKT